MTKSKWPDRGIQVNTDIIDPAVYIYIHWTENVHFIWQKPYQTSDTSALKYEVKYFREIGLLPVYSYDWILPSGKYVS